MSQSIQNQMKSVLKANGYSEETASQFLQTFKCETMEEFYTVLKVTGGEKQAVVTKEQFDKMSLGEKNDLFINHPTTYRALVGR